MNRTFKKIIFTWQLVLIALISFSSVKAAGEIDPTFRGGVTEFPNRNVFAIALQNDGKVLLGGNFEVANGYLGYSLARLNADATADRTFNAPLIIGDVRAITIQPDGKILIGGNFTIPLMTNPTVIARLNADGSFDFSFSTPTVTGSSGSVSDVAVAPDGKILIAGSFTYTLSSGVTRAKVARLNPNGTTDTAFNPTGTFTDTKDVEIQPDGKIVGVTVDGGGSGRFIKRFNVDGTEDASFNALVAGEVNAVRIQPDGKILVAGSFDFVNNIARTDAARLNTDGTLDATFNVTTTLGALNDIDLDVNGNIIIGGTFTQVNGVARINVARVDANGNLDNTFASNLVQILETVKSIVPLPNGKVLMLIGAPPAYGVIDIVIRLNTNGSRDDSFKGLVGTRGYVYEVIAQPDGKILVGGSFDAVNSSNSRALERFDADGSIDPNFNSPVITGNSSKVNTIVLQPDGKILVGGFLSPLEALLRLNPDGTPDNTYSAALSIPTFPATVNDLALLPDGKMIVAGSRNDAFLYKLNVDGSRDNTFSPTLTGSVLNIIAQPNGKILISGYFTGINGNPRGRIARLNADGTLDSTFNPLGGASTAIRAMALQTDGKIIIGGEFLSYNGTARNYLARLNSDGNPDTTFTTGTDNFVYAIKVEPNGKIIVGGEFLTVNGVSRIGLVRLTADGAIDLSFNSGTGLYGPAYALELQPDNKILVGGNFVKYNETPQVSIVRLLNSTIIRTPNDFDGDGKADLSVFRPSSGVWYQLNSTNNQQAGQQFGQTGDRIVPADYDGDGKTDLAVYRGGNWYIQRSSLGFTAVLFGDGADIPAPADYDGDGKADICVYRPSTGVWYQIKSSINQASFVAFGIAEDLPTAGDYDGDGKADISVFRPSAGTWYRINSSTGLWSGFAFGAAGDKTVQADYDGDGKTDFAVYRGGTWYLQRSQLGFTGVAFGDGADKPTPADYDGDGKADVAVFRPSNGVWYLLRTTQGFTGAAFGIAEDNPIPNAFVR